MYPFKLEPIYDRTIWGDHRLSDIRHVAGENYGTSWEVSAHPYAQNKILNGVYKGKNLLEMVQEYPKAMLGKHPKEAMLRTAFLDAKSPLSIQVHPDHGYALAHEGDLGKYEAWYVLYAEAGATLVAGSLCNDKEKIRQAIQSKTLESLLRYVDIEAGDFIYLPAGTLHALGGGILAIEFSTNSNTTYRFYDYGRKDANGQERPLHLEKSFDVVCLDNLPQKISTPLDVPCAHKVLLDDVFKEELFDIEDTLVLDTQGEDFHVLCIVHGEGTLEYAGQTMPLATTESLFVPADVGAYKLHGKCRVLLGTPKS